MEETWHPLLGVVGAILLGLPLWAWQQTGNDWGAVVLYALLAAGAALWLRGQRVPRTLAAFLVTAALVLGYLLPFGWLAVPPPE